MGKHCTVFGLLVALVCGLAWGPAAAADAEVRYVITNGGDDVEGKATVEYYPAGKHDGSRLGSAYSGGTVHLPEGSYSVHVSFSDGAAQWDKWFDNQAFSGKVELTVEVAQPITEIHYVVTNGGADVEGKATVEYYPAGKRDGQRVSSAYSGGRVRMPDGTYNVHVSFDDGTAHWDKWFDNQAFTGKVERTVEVAQQVAEIHTIVTNGGTDVGGKATVEYYPAGKHDGARLSSAYSGGTVRMPEGTYNMHVAFNDGTAHREIWLDNQAFSGKVEKTVEVAQQVAEIRTIVANGGADVGNKGVVEYFPAGKHDASRLEGVYSGGTVRMPEDTYDVRVTFTDGAAHKQAWLNGQAFSGKVEKTVEMGLTLAEPTVAVTQGGTDVGTQANVTYVGPADHGLVGSVASGQPLVIEAGPYDISARLGDAEAWLRGADVSGKPHFTIDLRPRPAAFALPPPAATAETIDPARGDFPYLPPLPGSRFIEGKADPAPVYVRTPDAKQPDLVANGSIMKVYRPPDGLTFPLLLSTYRDALLNSGWTIVNLSNGVDGMTAHQGQNGRNIWAFIRFRSDGYVLVVADATVAVSKLVAALNTQCHLALTGVLFDFDKSTLKPESDPVLTQVSAILAADHALRLEVQGHTDNVGSDAYNQPLSEARARSVVAWLTQHGVTPDRLSARGYGKTRPVASNATDAGRAQNRRVEIADPACKAR